VAEDPFVTSWQLSLHGKAPSTRQLYAEVIARFAKWLPAGTALVDVTRRDVQRYFTAMRATGRAPATLRSHWIVLRSFYGWAADEEEVDENPMLGVKVERGNPPPPKFPNDEDLALLLKACSGRGIWERRDTAMIRLAAATGMRISELLALEIRDVDLSQRVVQIRHGKGDKARFSRFDPATGAAVDRYIRARSRQKIAATTPVLFISRFGPFSKQAAQAMLGRRCVQAGIPHINWHAFRHRFAHQWLAKGGQEGDLAKLGGWSDPTVMRRYGSALATERALDAYDELGGVL
jgi:site-specific recombinase XerD